MSCSMRSEKQYLALQPHQPVAETMTPCTVQTGTNRQNGLLGLANGPAGRKFGGGDIIVSGISVSLVGVVVHVRRPFPAVGLIEEKTVHGQLDAIAVTLKAGNGVKITRWWCQRQVGIGKPGEHRGVVQIGDRFAVDSNVLAAFLLFDIQNPPNSRPTWLNPIS